ncbi:MAG: hypothetical protein K8S15_08860 [Candidatus Aegiribacteria sp.]|nr:hypothetical protein [Candidatus Aegiribacteria sp.]
MKPAAVLIIVFFVLLSLACKTDYDIAEVASQEYLGATHHHETHDSDHEAVEQDSVDDENHEDDASGIAGTDRHVHDAGQRNHGTGWFFNQPWAASFIWGKMIRDTVILLALAAAVLLVSGYRRKHR